MKKKETVKRGIRIEFLNKYDDGCDENSQGGVVQFDRDEETNRNIVVYESNWILTDFWLPLSLVFSICSFIVSIYVGFVK